MLPYNIKITIGPHNMLTKGPGGELLLLLSLGFHNVTFVRVF